MIKKKNQVNKMLSPEETSLLQDVMAGLSVILGSNNAGAIEETTEGSGAQQVEMELDQQTIDPEKENVIKACEPDDVEKSSDGPTANEKADPRLEDGTEITEGNLGAVAKAIVQLANKGSKPVQKSKSTTDANEVAQIVLKALGPVISRIGTVEKDMNAMLEAVGFGDAMDTVEKAENPINTIQKSVNTGLPVTNQDSGDIINLIGSAVANELMKAEQVDSVVGGPKYKTTNTVAHKELGSLISAHHLGAK